MGTQKPNLKKVGREFQEFVSGFDKNYIVPQKIKAALEKLGDAWEYESQFLKLAEVSPLDLSAFRDQFSDHVVVVDRSKRLWVGTKAMATKMRERL